LLTPRACLTGAFAKLHGMDISEHPPTMEGALHAGALPEGTRSLIVEGCTEADRVGCRKGRINVCIRRRGQDIVKRTRCMREVATLGKFLQRSGNSCGRGGDACPVALPGFQTTSTNRNYFDSSCDYGERNCCTSNLKDGVTGVCVEKEECAQEQTCTCFPNFADGNSCTWECGSRELCFVKDRDCEGLCPISNPSSTTSTNPNLFGVTCEIGEECCLRQPEGGGDCVSSCFPELDCRCNENDDGSSCNWQCFFTEACSVPDLNCVAPSCPVEFPGFGDPTSTNSNFFDSICDYGESTCCEPRQNDAGDCVIPFCFQDKTCVCTENADDTGNSCTWQCFEVDPLQSCFEKDPNCPAPSCPIEIPDFGTISTNPNFFGATCDFGEECCLRQPDGGGDCFETCFPNENCFCDAEDGDESSCTWSCFSTDECSFLDPACDASCPVSDPSFTTSTNPSLFGVTCEVGEICCLRQSEGGGDCVSSCFSELGCRCNENDDGSSCTWRCAIFEACSFLDPACEDF
jgi:hypothetical protein